MQAFVNLFKEFFESERTGGFILIACTLFSLIISNSFIGADYINFWHTMLDLSFWGISLDFSIEYWINDALMAVFFLLVGLEIEREIYIGEISSMQKAVIPIAAAAGGMILPGLIHFTFNAGTATQSGFAIPMATDIAFALGILSLAGKRVPVSVRIFLTAFAIIDDLGAILIIAVFYTDTLNFGYLLVSLGIFGLLLLFNRLRLNALWLYIIPGMAMWYCMHHSGVHATISGVMLAFAIPFHRDVSHNPSYKVQHFLHIPVAFFIIPLFALANTAVVLPDYIFGSLATENSLGIIFGLFLGKVSGVFLFTFIAVKSGLGRMYEGLTWKYLIGAGFLGGIGFTMSIFITNLAFSSVELIASSKLSILTASLMCAIFGISLLKLAGRGNNFN